jgi:ribose transport system ATP-binding protein
MTGKIMSYKYVFEARNIQKYFGGVCALKNGNFCIREGQICGLLGANGSGKTTLSKIIYGLLQPENGALLMHGEEVTIKSPSQAKEIGIAMVHQHLSLVPELTVWQNIMLGHEPKNTLGLVDNVKAQESAEKAIHRLSEHISIQTKVKTLSPSQKQLVEIAKALSFEPKLLILDEPTAALEQEEVEKLFSVMQELKERNVSIVFISHRMWEVLRICDYVTVFRNGEFVGEVDFQTDSKDEKQIVTMITGNQNDVIRAATAGVNKLKAKEGSTFSVKHIHLANILKDITITINQGEILGISGLQGQGQEELLLLLAGLLKPDKGEFLWDTSHLKISCPKDAIRQGIVLVPGDRNEEGLFTQHSVLDNLSFPQFPLKKNRFFIDFKRQTNEARRIIDKMLIKPKDETKVVRYLSGGNQQKVVVGKWLSIEPKVLLLSDPAKGVDIQAKKELYAIVKELAQVGTAVIVYASDNKELVSICDRVLVMFEGSIVEELDHSQLTEEVLTAYSLRARYAGLN